MKEEPKDFDEGEGGVGEGDEGDDADGVGQVFLILIYSRVEQFNWLMKSL